MLSVRLSNRSRSPGLRIDQPGLEIGDPSFQIEHSLHARKVEALVGELLDPGEESDIGVAVAATAATGALRLNQPLAFINPERLRMHA